MTPAMVRAPSDEWMSVPVGAVLGAVLAAGFVMALSAAGERTGTEIAAVVLAVVYAIYIGVALTRGRGPEVAIEVVFAGVGLTMVGLGLWQRPEWLAGGFALHGVWDLLHHRDRHVLGVRGIPVWYVPSCVVYDWIAAAGVLLVL
jgi:hypothetical protein